MDLRPGSEFAGYRIERELGRGGMGVVYLAEQRFPNRKVALKILAPELARDQRFRDRFVRESNLAASLDHPNIVPIHAAGEEDGVLYLAMRYVEGTDLRQVITEHGPLTLERTTGIVRQVAAALDAAHRRGMVHRDVKSSNVLLVPGDEPGSEHAYLSDFGLTKRVSSDSGLTGTGQFMGSLDYAAPEQFEGKPLDARTDVYSLGCVVFECLCGDVPFRSETEAAVVYAHLQDPPPRATVTRPDLPPAVDGVIAKAMAKSPDDRHETAGVLSRDLSRAAAPPAAAKTTGGSRSAGRRRPAALVGTLAGAVVVVAAILALLLRGGAGDTTHGASPSQGQSPTATQGSPSPRSSYPSITEQTVDRVDPSTNRVTASVAVPQALGDGFDGIVSGEGGLWVVDHEGSLVHLDPRTGQLDTVIRQVQPFDVAVEQHGDVWATISAGQHFPSIAVVDPAKDLPVEFLPMCEPAQCPGSIASGNNSVMVAFGSIWVAASRQEIVLKFDAATHQSQDRIKVSNLGDTPHTMTSGFGSVWVLDTFDDQVDRIDPSTDRIVGRIGVPGATPWAIQAGAGQVWVISDNGNVFMIDPSTNQLARSFFLGKHLNDVGVGLGSLWVVGNVADGPDGTVFRIDPSTQETISAIRVGGSPQSLAITPKAVWVTVQP